MLSADLLLRAAHSGGVAVAPVSSGPPTGKHQGHYSVARGEAQGGGYKITEWHV